MNWLLITAALAYNPGDRVVDLRDKIPQGMNSIYLVVTVEPIYTRFSSISRDFRTASSIAAVTGRRPSSRCPSSTADTASGKASRR